jgi:Txe/YoeB family toxin of Txe-Axe toxin-antitoxin module
MTFQAYPEELISTEQDKKKTLREVTKLIKEIEKEQLEGKKPQQPIKKCPFCGRPMGA